MAGRSPSRSSATLRWAEPPQRARRSPARIERNVMAVRTAITCQSISGADRAERSGGRHRDPRCDRVARFGGPDRDDVPAEFFEQIERHIPAGRTAITCPPIPRGGSSATFRRARPPQRARRPPGRIERHVVAGRTATTSLSISRSRSSVTFQRTGAPHRGSCPSGSHVTTASCRAISTAAERAARPRIAADRASSGRTNRTGGRRGVDADVIVVGAGLAGLVATAELADAGRTVIVARPGARAEPRRAGVLVARRVVPRRLARAAAAGDPGLGRPGAVRTGWAAPAFDRGVDDPAGEDFWARQWATAYVDFAAGEKRSLAARAGDALDPDRRVGRARRAPGRRARQLGAPVPPHLGHRTGRAGAVRAPGPRRRRRGARRAAVPAPGGRADRHRRRRRRRARRACCARTTRSAARPRSRDEIGSVRAVRGRRCSSPPAASARTSTWSARTGRSASAPPPEHMISGVPGARGRPDARDLRGRPARGWSTATGCGTTPRASRTGTRSGPGTASGSSPGRRRCGSTRPGAGSRRRTSPASTRSARSGPCAPPATSTAGSCSPRRSSRRSSRCPGPSRTRTSPARTCAPRSAGSARAPRPRWRRSRSGARTSSSRTRCPSSSPG